MMSSCRRTRLDRLLGLHEVEAPRISGQPAHECVKAVSPKHRPPLPKDTSLVLC